MKKMLVITMTVLLLSACTYYKGSSSRSMVMAESAESITNIDS